MNALQFLEQYEIVEQNGNVLSVDPILMKINIFGAGK